VESKPKGRSEVLCQEVSDGCVLYDPDAEKVYVFNPTAAFIWSCCDGEHDRDGIMAALTEALGEGAPSREQLSKDVETSLAEFDRLGLFAGP
jgi:hypothetical protein